MDLVCLLLLHILLCIVLIILIVVTKSACLLVLFLLYLVIFWKTLALALAVLVQMFRMFLFPSDRRANFHALADLCFKQYLDAQIQSEEPRDGKPKIYVSNYPDTPFEYLILGLFNDPIVMTRKLSEIGPAAYLSGMIFNEETYIGVSGKGNSYTEVKAEIAKKIQEQSIFAYVENVKLRENKYRLTPLRTGVFSIARELNIPIVPVVIDHIKYDCLGRITQPNLKIFIGPEFLPKNATSTESYITTIADWMQDKLTQCQA